MIISYPTGQHNGDKDHIGTMTKNETKIDNIETILTKIETKNQGSQINYCKHIVIVGYSYRIQ